MIFWRYYIKTFTLVSLFFLSLATIYHFFISDFFILRQFYVPFLFALGSWEESLLWIHMFVLAYLWSYHYRDLSVLRIHLSSLAKVFSFLVIGLVFYLFYLFFFIPVNAYLFQYQKNLDVLHETQLFIQEQKEILYRVNNELIEISNDSSDPSQLEKHENFLDLKKVLLKNLVENYRTLYILFPRNDFVVEHRFFLSEYDQTVGASIRWTQKDPLKTNNFPTDGFSARDLYALSRIYQTQQTYETALYFIDLALILEPENSLYLVSKRDLERLIRLEFKKLPFDPGEYADLRKEAIRFFTLGWDEQAYYRFLELSRLFEGQDTEVENFLQLTFERLSYSHVFLQDIERIGGKFAKLNAFFQQRVEKLNPESPIDYIFIAAMMPLNGSIFVRDVDVVRTTSGGDQLFHLHFPYASFAQGRLLLNVLDKEGPHPRVEPLLMEGRYDSLENLVSWPLETSSRLMVNSLFSLDNIDTYYRTFALSDLLALEPHVGIFVQLRRQIHRAMLNQIFLPLWVVLLSFLALTLASWTELHTEVIFDRVRDHFFAIRTMMFFLWLSILAFSVFLVQQIASLILEAFFFVAVILTPYWPLSLGLLSLTALLILYFMIMLYRDLRVTIRRQRALSKL